MPRTFLRNGTTTQCTPWHTPPTHSCPKTAADVPWSAAFPMYVFVAVGVGECTTISSVSGSYVSVVSRFCTSEPWPISVIAKQPRSVAVTMSGIQRAICSSVPSPSIAPPQSPYCTPALIVSDRSPYDSASKPMTTAAGSAGRPGSGKPLLP